MQKEIGSYFWIDKEYENKDVSLDMNFLNVPFKDYELFSTGRSAIKFILQSLNLGNKRVLIPGYTCESVSKPFKEEGYKIKYFQVKENLVIDSKELESCIERYQPSVILFHRYFGFNGLDASSNKVLEGAKKQGIILIEDITQSMFSKHPLVDVDFYIGSIRKWFGVLDGAFALNVNGKFSKQELEQDHDFISLKYQGSFNKFQYIQNSIGLKEKFLEDLNTAEDLLENEGKFYSMDNISKAIFANTDLENLKTKRKENYKFFYEEVKNLKGITPVFTPEENATPLYFAVETDLGLKNKIKKYMAQHDIYLPSVWPSPTKVCDHLKNIVVPTFEHILCFPIDQRYGLDDMKRMADCLKEVIINEN